MSSLSAFENLLNDCSIWRADSRGAGITKIDSASHILTKGLDSKLKEAFSISISPEIDSSLAHEGLKLGAFHEFFSKTRELQTPFSILSALAINTFRSFGASNKYFLWVGKDSWPEPHFLKKLSSHSFLDQCLFIDPKNEKLGLWVTESALRSSAAACVIARLKTLSFVTSRRLALACEKGNSLGLFARNFKESSIPSSATTRWLIESAAFKDSFNPRFKLSLLKQKGGPLLSTDWIIEISQNGKTIPSCILSAMVSKPCKETTDAETAEAETVSARTLPARMQA